MRVVDNRAQLVMFNVLLSPVRHFDLSSAALSGFHRLSRSYARVQIVTNHAASNSNEVVRLLRCVGR